MLRDLRQALRTFRRNPGFAIVAVLALALGIGANTTIFSVLNGLVLKPLDFAEPERLVVLHGVENATRRTVQRVREIDVAEWRRHTRTLERVEAAYSMGLSITSFEEPTNPLMRRVTGGYFELLGVKPLHGRIFSPEDDVPGGGKVVILHHDFWQEHFGGDPGVIGKTLELAYEPYEIVGVLPAAFRNPLFPDVPALWLPMGMNQAAPDRKQANLVAIGRLAPGVSLRQAQGELETIAGELATRDPATFGERGAKVISAHDAVVEVLRAPLFLLLGAVAFVLLIACSNVANLLLARAMGRQREIAVRLAMGASRGHLLRQLLAESLLLSFAGAGLGLLLASWSLEPIARLAPSNFNVPRLEEITIDVNVLLFTALLAVVTGAIFGLAPARQALRGEIDDCLGIGAARSTGDRRRRRLRSSLVVAEIALSVTLLIAAGLVMRSFLELQGLPRGFDPEQLLHVRTTARGPQFGDPARWEDFYRQVLERVAVLPGVEAVGACSSPPMFNQFGEFLPLVPPGGEARDGAAPRALVRVVTLGFFNAFGMTPVAGRDFTAADRAGGEPVVVVSRLLARQLWEGRDAVGQQLETGGEHPARYRVVGVVGDVRGTPTSPEPVPTLYFPLAQRPTATLSLMVRTHDDPLAQLRPIELAILGLSRDVPVFTPMTVEQMLYNIDWQPRFLLTLLGIFAGLALVLAAMGIYAVLSYTVAERTREIGVRMAVGAGRGNVLRLVLTSSLRLAAVGIALGAGGALALSGMLRSQLYGVEADDPATYLAIALGVVGVTLLAGYVPARRALRVDPVIALRND